MMASGEIRLCGTMMRRMPVSAQSNKPTTCHTKLPDGSTPSKNRQRLNDQLQSMLNDPMTAESALFNTLGSWLGDVAPGGPQDYKLTRQPGSEAQGNFNFGATGTLFFGPLTPHSGAGIVQVLTHPSGSDGGIPFVRAPYWDAWDDYADIQAGIDAGC